MGSFCCKFFSVPLSLRHLISDLLQEMPIVFYFVCVLCFQKIKNQKWGFFFFFTKLISHSIGWSLWVFVVIRFHRENIVCTSRLFVCFLFLFISVVGGSLLFLCSIQLSRYVVMVAWLWLLVVVFYFKKFFVLKISCLSVFYF